MMRYKLFLLFLLVSSMLNAQNLTVDQVSSLIEKQEFKFVATKMLPSRGPSKYLTEGEGVVYVGETVKSYLPFIGVAYTPMIGEEPGIKFTSERFEYSVKEKKKSWLVDVKTKDQMSSTTLNFNIGSTGSATLYVTSIKRQGIQFIGYIEAMTNTSKEVKKDSKLVLDNYTIPIGKQGALIGKLSLAKAKLVKDDSDLFTLDSKGNLSLKADKTIKESDPISYNITIKVGEEKKKFTLVKDQFIRNKVISHRGAWKNTATSQNSLGALNASIEMGCEASELDVWLSADNVLILSHDPTIGGLNVEKSTSEQLSKVKLKKGESIPTLRQYLERIMQQNKTRLVVELKISEAGKNEKLVKETVSLVHEMGAQAWVEYISFGFDIVKQIRELDASTNIAYLENDKTLDEIKRAGMSGIDFHYSHFYKGDDICEKARKKGLTTNVWTINSKDKMKELLKMGVDYITSDEPEMLLELLKEM